MQAYTHTWSSIPNSIVVINNCLQFKESIETPRVKSGSNLSGFYWICWKGRARGSFHRINLINSHCGPSPPSPYSASETFNYYWGLQLSSWNYIKLLIVSHWWDGWIHRTASMLADAIRGNWVGIDQATNLATNSRDPFVQHSLTCMEGGEGVLPLVI